MTSPVFEKGYPDYDAVNRQEPYAEYMKRMDRERDNKWDNRFMNMAQMISTWSKDPSSQIGAVAVNNDRRILATGYNGFPRGIADTDERLNDRDEKYPRIIHAEMNVLMNALYNGVSLKDATIYVYGLPICPDCTKSVIQAGVKRVVLPYPIEVKGKWKQVWEDQSKPMFKEAGIIVSYSD